MQILETLDVGVIYTDINGNMLYINKLAEEIRGIDRNDKLDTNVVDCHAPKGRPNVKDLLAKFKNGSIDHRHRLVRIRGKYFDNKYLVVREPGAEPSGIVLMSQDVTEKVQLKQKLDKHYQTLEDEIEKKSREIEARYEEMMKMQQRLMHSEKMSSLGQFVSIIAHEVNNPLDGIKNCLQEIKEAPDNLEQTRKYSSLALDALTKIEEVTRLILNYARPDNYYMDEVSITEVIEESIKFAHYKLARNNIRLDAGLEHDISVNGSKQHLAQVFVNMIMNSIDAINEKRGKASDNQKSNGSSEYVRISIQDCGENACIKIEDSGCGIATENVNELFKPFYTTKKDKGTGLGLYICFNIVYIHNGKISVTSIPGKGTSFTIQIPKYSYSDVGKSMEKVSELKDRVLQGYIEQ